MRIFLVLLIILSLLNCTLVENHAITCIVEGTVIDADIIFIKGDDKTLYLYNILLPWSYKFDSESNSISLTASKLVDAGTLIIKIYDGEDMVRMASTDQSFGSINMIYDF